MTELKSLQEESIDFVSITPNNNEIHIKYKNEKLLVIGSGSGPINYGIANSKMEMIEDGYVFEEDLAHLLNIETVKAIDDITVNVFKMHTDHKKSTLLGLCDSNTPLIVKDMLTFLADLHFFFNQKTV